MLVMPANQRGLVCGWLAGRFPDRIGHLYSPPETPRVHSFMPFACDNGRFPCWQSGKAWDELAYLRMLDHLHGQGSPRWLLVPDVVGDRDATLRQWEEWAPRLRAYRSPLAFAVQDGMEWGDVPSEAEVVFVGGSTEWKWRTVRDWCSGFARVHVGRVNTNGKLWECHEAGAESCDGTGWFRGDQRQLNGLVTYLERSSQNLGNHRGGLLWAK